MGSGSVDRVRWFIRSLVELTLTHFRISPLPRPMCARHRAKPHIDENTIGVCPILGSTFDGTFEDVKGACRAFDGLW